MSKIKANNCINLDSKSTAFPYQNQAFLSVKDLDYCAIFHEQGLGKTKIAIDLMLYWLRKKNIDTVLVVTKKQLIQNWVEEFSLHTFIKPQVLSNDKNNNFYVLNSPAKVIITNFETIPVEKERIKLFLKSRDTGVIIDESTKLKNPNTKLTQTFFEIAPLFKKKAIMSGTPVANRPYDIWSQIFFLDEGKSLGTNYEEFKKNTDLNNNLAQDDTARINFEDNVAQIFDKISDFTVRETKESCAIVLPQKIYQTIYCDFEEEQFKMYNHVIKDLCVEIQKEGKHLIDDDSIALKRLIRLLQITSNPKLVDEHYNSSSGKEIQLESLLNSIIEKEEKCIVWSNFIENINIFSKKYSYLGACKVHGSLSINERNKAIEKFKNDKNCKVLFATPQAAKEGLTLTVANNVIFYDRGFNLDDYLQAQDRIHRISQKKECYIYNLVIRGSIDEWISSLLEAKQYAASLAQGDIQVESYSKLASYSYGELLREILGNGGDLE